MSEVVSIYTIVLFLSQISITEDGAAANFTRSFAMKAGYYICYSKVRDACAVKTPSHVGSLRLSLSRHVSLPAQESAGGMVVSDIQLITDKESIPHGYCYIAEHLEPSECHNETRFLS